MPYHVRISTHSQRDHDEVRLDLTAEDLETRFLAPYRDGRPLVINGRAIFPPDLARIVITETDRPSEAIRPLVEAEESEGPLVIPPIPIDWLIADKGRDVTDDFVLSPPGTPSATSVNPPGQT